MAYKATDKDMKCRGYQYTVGETEKTDSPISVCDHGFHACEVPMDVMNYYPQNTSRFFEVEQSGSIIKGDDKTVSSEITITSEEGEGERMKKKSQCQQILEHLQSGKTLTGLEALDLCGTICLPRRILDLKEKGYNIQSEPADIPDNPAVDRYFMPEFREATQKTLEGFGGMNTGRY